MTNETRHLWRDGTTNVYTEGNDLFIDGDDIEVFAAVTLPSNPDDLVKLLQGIIEASGNSSEVGLNQFIAGEWMDL